MNRKFFSKVLAACSFVIFFIQCSKKQNEDQMAPSGAETVQAERTYKPTVIVSGRSYYETIFSAESDTVLLHLDGGPDSLLDRTSYGVYFNLINESKSKPWRIIKMHQANTLNQSIWKERSSFTYEDVAHENNISMQILDLTINQLLIENKTIVLSGHSFGGYLIWKYLAEKEEKVRKLHKVVIMGAKPDLEETFLDTLRTMTPCGYDEENKPVACPEKEMLEDNGFYVRQKLSYDLLKTDYTRAVPHKDLSNLIFIYGQQDYQGRLKENEQAFLEASAAHVMLWENEDHTSYLEKKERVTEIIK